MNENEIKAWRRLGLALAIALLGVTLALPSRAQEVSTGVTVRSSGMTNGEHWELTWYDSKADWRWGIGYTSSQKVPGPVLKCGSLGYMGEMCRWTEGKIKVKPYVSTYVQRIWTYSRTYAAFGIALHPQRDPLLSAHGSFRTSFGWRIDEQWTLEWTHMSNASIKSPNWGQDLLLIRYMW